MGMVLQAEDPTLKRLVALGLVAEDEFLALLDLVAERRAADVFTASARLGEAGADYAILLSGFSEMLRAQLAIELGAEVPDTSERLRAALIERTQSVAQQLD